MEKIIPAKWFLKDLEAVALEWLAGQFTGRAAEKWTRVVAQQKCSKDWTDSDEYLREALRCGLKGKNAWGKHKHVS